MTSLSLSFFCAEEQKSQTLDRSFLVLFLSLFHRSEVGSAQDDSQEIKS